MNIDSILAWIFTFITILAGSAGVVDEPVVVSESGEVVATVATATVAFVVDGDTVELEDGTRVRLIGIDTPERERCYFEEARAELQALVLNQNVTLTREVSDTDTYGRSLRHLTVGTTSVAEQLVASGAARAIAIAPDTSTYGKLKELEAAAREARRGRWGACLPGV